MTWTRFSAPTGLDDPPPQDEAGGQAGADPRVGDRARRPRAGGSMTRLRPAACPSKACARGCWPARRSQPAATAVRRLSSPPRPASSGALRAGPPAEPRSVIGSGVAAARTAADLRGDHDLLTATDDVHERASVRVEEPSGTTDSERARRLGERFTVASISGTECPLASSLLPMGQSLSGSHPWSRF